jgi:hypothetical protein
MPAASKNIYQAMMTKGSNNGKLNKKQLRVAVAKEKSSLLESNQTDPLKALDIVDLLANHCLSDSSICINDTESELTSYRKFAKILDKILDDTMLNMLDGENTCKTFKPIAKTHEKIHGSNIPLNNALSDTLI